MRWAKLFPYQLPLKVQKESLRVVGVVAAELVDPAVAGRWHLHAPTADGQLVHVHADAVEDFRIGLGNARSA